MGRKEAQDTPKNPEPRDRVCPAQKPVFKRSVSCLFLKSEQVTLVPLGVADATGMIGWGNGWWGMVECLLARVLPTDQLLGLPQGRIY